VSEPDDNAYADRDLGELFARITRRLVDAEHPILVRHGLEMWPYVVLTALGRRPAATQLQLAQQIGYDKTRLIALLDDLVEQRLVERRPDPADRRARNVSLTAAGIARLSAVRAEIREMEEGFLAALEPGAGRELRALLARLAAPGA
jgi:DNA-binding MarR family transcriptional regulator